MEEEALSRGGPTRAMGHMKSPHGPKDQDKVTPGLTSRAPPPPNRYKRHPRHARSGQGDERKLRTGRRRLAACQNRDPALRLGGAVGSHSPGSRSSELQFKTVRLPIKWVGPERRRVSGGPDILQEEWLLASWGNIRVLGKKRMVFIVPNSFSELPQFVCPGREDHNHLFMITQKFNRVRPPVRERWGSTVNETDPWRDKREPPSVRIKMRMGPRGNRRHIGKYTQLLGRGSE